MTRRIDIPSRQVLLKYLDYDPETGCLTWRPRTIEDFQDCQQPQSRYKTFNRRYAGKEALTCLANGQRHGSFMGLRLHAARVVWKMAYNDEPLEVICLNGDHNDLRLKNLQASAKIYSGKNTTMFSNNKSGVRGVSWCNIRNLWVSRITVNRKVKHLGYFTTIDRAASARRSAEVKYGFKPRGEMIGDRT